MFGDMPDWTNAVVRLPYPNWDSQARPATQVVVARSPEPPTFHVKQWVRRTYRFPLVANSGRRSRLRIASTGRMGQHACLCIALIPDPARKRGPRRVSSPKTTSYCRSSRRFCIGFPPASAISSNLARSCPCAAIARKVAFRAARAGIMSLCPAVAAVCPSPVGLDQTAAHLLCLARPAVRSARNGVLCTKA